MTTALLELEKLDDTDTLAVAAEEGRCLYKLVRLYRPKTILEVGTGHGYSTAWIAEAMSSSDTLYTIDWQDYVNTKWPKKDIRVIHGELGGCLDLLPSSIDFAFLDSQHQIEKIVADVELIEPRLTDGALVVVHDTEYAPEMGRCLKDYFLGEDSERLHNVGVLPSTLDWDYQFIKSKYGLGIATKRGKA